MDPWPRPRVLLARAFAAREIAPRTAGLLLGNVVREQIDPLSEDPGAAGTKRAALPTAE